MKSITDKIRAIRQAKGLSQENVAWGIGLSNNGYSNIERGVTDLTVGRLMQIAEFLGVTPNEIINFGEQDCLIELKQKNDLLKKECEMLKEHTKTLKTICELILQKA